MTFVCNGQVVGVTDWLFVFELWVKEQVLWESETRVKITPIWQKLVKFISVDGMQMTSRLF